MEPCFECGSSSVQTRFIAGVSVQECGLCGAVAGNQHAVREYEDGREAVAAGVAPELWPLVRILDALPGLRVHEQHAGEPARDPLPRVGIMVLDARGLVQIENLAKTLLLASGALQLSWGIEVEYRDVLVFVLRPRPPQRAATARQPASADLAALAAAIGRNQKLSWWRTG